MGAKYYTRFLLLAAEPGTADEFTGVVELAHPINKVLEPREIEALLAQSFQVETSEVEVLNWSRVK